MMKNLTIKHSLITLALLLTITLVLFTGITTAWLGANRSTNSHLELGQFQITVTATDSGTPLSMTNGTYALNGLSIADANANGTFITSDSFLENFAISVVINAEIDGYLRVKVQDEWTVTRSYIYFDREHSEVIFRADNALFSYHLSQGWYYDPISKYCYYENLINKGTTDLEIPFINGGENYTPKTSSAYRETCKIVFSTRIEMVQANRFEAIWGISTIPTTSTGGGE